MEIINFIIFILSILVLFYSGGLLVKSLTALGRYMQFSEYVLSFILVAFATSLPELFVGINSAFRGVSLISLGNIVGANVLNISLVLGIAIVFARGLDAEKPMEKEDTFFVLGIMIAPTLMIIDGVMGRLDGTILLVLFSIYLIYLIKNQYRSDKVNQIISSEIIRINPIKQFLLFLLGAGLLLASSSFVVSYGIDVANYFVLPLFLVGILISLGTTLPEIVFSVKSVAMKHGSMSLGNVFGSVIINVAFILGLVAVINPIVVENLNRTLIGMLLTIILVAIVNILAATKKRLEYNLGVFLIFIAVIFVVITTLFR